LSLQRFRLLASILAGGAAVALAVVTIENDSSLYRIGVAALIIAAVFMISLESPRVATLAVICCLPLLALVRRLLIPVSGWTQWDALLVVAPVISIILAYRLFVLQRRVISKDVLSSLIGFFLLLEVLESVNPVSKGLTAGLTGLLFAAAPLAWFFIGRELADRGAARVALTSAVIVGLGVALYGLWQTNVGFPTWDAAWQTITGYASLNIAGSIRAFGTFSSSGEYATFLGMAFVVAFVGILYRRLVAVVALPILGYALILASSRTVVVLVLLSLAVATGIRTGRALAAGLSMLLATAAAAATIAFLGPQLTNAANQSGNGFIQHEVGGLLNPFDPQQSTLPIHQRQVIGGVIDSFAHPLGLGLAAINPQVTRLSGYVSSSTEVDISNAFVALGPLGGLTYVLVIIITLWQASRLAFARQEPASLAALVLLVTGIGQWLNGGYYAVAPLVWFFVGWVNREWLENRAREQASVRAKQLPRTTPAWPSPVLDW
jgi:hypothetical protein